MPGIAAGPGVTGTVTVVTVPRATADRAATRIAQAATAMQAAADRAVTGTGTLVTVPGIAAGPGVTGTVTAVTVPRAAADRAATRIATANAVTIAGRARADRTGPVRGARAGRGMAATRSVAVAGQATAVATSRTARSAARRGTAPDARPARAARNETAPGARTGHAHTGPLTPAARRSSRGFSRDMSDRIGGSFPEERAERGGYGRDRRPGGRDPRQQRPARPGGAGRGGRPDRSAEGSGAGFRPRQADDRDRRAARRSDRDSGAAPRIPDSITEDDLSRDVKAELRGLPADLAATVGRYLVAAELAGDPEQAYRYAQAARRIAARIGVVREVNGITAYQTGRWAEALAELRAARRLTGRDEYLPLMADSERALGRLDAALELVHSDDARRLPRAAQIELRIVESGIRRDQGLADAAVLVLQVPELTDGRLRPWSARLFYAYGDALLAAGRPEAAREAFSRAVVADEEEETDALSRLDELDGVTLEDLEDYEDEDDLDDEADVDRRGRRHRRG